MYRRNAAERAIRTFKNHFIAILYSTDPDFLLRLWDRLLPQALTTLNLLRGSRINPKLSAYAQLNGAFDFNRTPMGPPGTRGIGYMNYPKHAELGHRTPYPDGTLDQRLNIIDATECTLPRRPKSGLPTRSYGIRRTLSCQKQSSANAATAAARDLIYALQNPHPAAPIAPLADDHRKGLQNLAEIFQQVTTHPEPAPRVRFANN